MSAGADTVAQYATDSAAFIAETSNAAGSAVETVNEVIKGMRNVDRNAKSAQVQLITIPIQSLGFN